MRQALLSEKDPVQRMYAGQVAQLVHKEQKEKVHRQRYASADIC